MAPAAAEASPARPAVLSSSSSSIAGLPPAATAPEPALPVPAGWNGSEDFSRTSGTSRYSDGALLWTDWLYDDTGTADFSYTGDGTGSNGADVFRAAVTADDDATHWRVDWNTLIDADVPIAAWTFDTDSDPSTGAALWPAKAGVSSPGIDVSLVVSSRGAWLVDAVTGAERDVVAEGGSLTVDMAARSFVVSVPRSVLPVEGTWTARLGAGVANAHGTGFAAAPEAPDGSRVYNAAFRDLQDEPLLVGGTRDASTEWSNGRQSERLAAADMTPFALAVDWSQVLSGASTPEPLPTGFSTRWFVSSVDLGQGRDPAARRSPGPALQPATYFGRVQPYTVYVPADYRPDTPAPLTILLHGGNANHNGFVGDRKDAVYQPLCEERGSICVSPLGRGMSSWYINHAEVDVWEVWNRAAASYTLDSERTLITGFSMGGVGATRLLTNHPDVFAGGGIVSGAGYFNSAGQRDREGAEARVENLGSTQTFIDSGSLDIAQANTRRWDAAAEAAGVPYRAHYYEGADHGALGTWIGWRELAEHLDGAALTRDPASLSFRWEPGDGRADLGVPIDSHFWLTALASRDESSRWSRIEADSLARQTMVLEPVLTDRTEVIDGRNVQIRDQRLVPTTSIEPSNVLRVSAENVATVAADLDAAALDRTAPALVDVTTDGTTELTLVRGDERRTVTLAAGRHEITGPEAPRSPRVHVAGKALQIRWTPPASALPIDGYTVRDASGAVVCETRAVQCKVAAGSYEADASFTVTALSIVGSSTEATARR